MTKTFIAISMLMTFSTAFANTLTGSCVVTQTGSATETITFSLKASKDTLVPKTYSVKVPLENTYNDDYSIYVTNTTGISDAWDPNMIELAVGVTRYFCSPPVLQNGGGVSRTKCDRPQGWEVVSGGDRIISPKAGDTLTFQGATDQISFSCEAVLN